MERVPTNLITGFLGSGKTTLIRRLLDEHRHTGERWAVLVNEFGEVGIDGAALGEGAAVAELPGGCLCCTLGAPFRTTLAQLLRRQNPSRLLIEPTGLGHPARILDQLTPFAEQGAIDLRATVTLVDPRQLEDARVTEHAGFQDQVQLADCLVAHKIDRCTEAQRAVFWRWAHDLFPPKGRIAETSHGAIDAKWLDAATGFAAPREAPPSTTPHHGAGHSTAPANRPPAEPAPGNPSRLEQDRSTPAACGWLFHRDDTFERTALLTALEELRGCQRAKGILRTGRDWLRIDVDSDGVRAEAAAWRGESRLEVIGPPAGLNWEHVEQRLLAARRSGAEQG